MKIGSTVGTNKIKSYTSALIYASYHIINGNKGPLIIRLFIRNEAIRIMNHRYVHLSRII